MATKRVRRTPSLFPSISRAHLHDRVEHQSLTKAVSLPELKVQKYEAKSVHKLVMTDLHKPLPLQLRALPGKQLGYRFGLRLALYAAKICKAFTGSLTQMQALKNFCASEGNLLRENTRAQNLTNDNAEKRLIAIHKVGKGRLYSNDLEHIYQGYVFITKHWEPLEDAIPGYIDVVQAIYKCLATHRDRDKKPIFDVRRFHRLPALLP